MTDVSTFPAEPNPAWDDEPKAGEPCVADYCVNTCEAGDTKGTAGFFFREVSDDGADVMVYCMCDHHGGKEYRSRVYANVGYGY